MAFINRVSMACAFVLAGSLMLAPSAVLAHGGGKGGGRSGTHDNMGTGDSDPSPNGGMSASHMSEDGMENTNGPNATDRDTGPDRAEDRTGANTDADTDVDNDVDNEGPGGDERSHTAVPGTDTDETGGD